MESTIATYIFIVLTSLVGCYYTIITILVIHSHQQRQHINKIANSYVQQILAAQIDEQKDSHILAQSPPERMALIEAINLIMSHTYSTPSAKIREIATSNHLEKFLLGKLRWSRSTHTARLLQYMSSIPIGANSLTVISRYLSCDDRQIRISALIASLAHSPTTAIRIIAGLPYQIKPYDTSRIITLLRRGLLPIAYEPLLRSNNHNLLLLGIAITHSFGIEIADKHLLNIILHNKEQQIVREAIYSLSTLGRSLGRQYIQAKLSTMAASHRRELCHHLSSEGYSLAALRVLFSESEIKEVEPLINSYKRDLICLQSN